jgi:hypothetical protein
VADVALSHLARVPDGVVSFGQGCEGEPLLFGPILVEAARRIRARTARGTLNLNTNASRPEVVRELCDAGLDSIRASLNSPRPALYDAYYQPRGYACGRRGEPTRGRAAGGHASLNLLCFPASRTRRPARRVPRCRGHGLHMIQLRNLNIDPTCIALAAGRHRQPGAVRCCARSRAVSEAALGCFNRRGGPLRPGAAAISWPRSARPA